MKKLPPKRRAASPVPDPNIWSREAIKETPSKAIPAFLTSSFIYYHQSDLRPIMSDTDFDWLCRYLLLNYRRITHAHKYLVRRESLKAGTGFDLPFDAYPMIVRSVAVQMSLGTIMKVTKPPVTTPKRKEAPPRRKRQPTRGFLS